MLLWCVIKLHSHIIECTHFFFLLALQPLWALAAFLFPDLFTIGRTPWTCDQPVAKPLPKHRTAQTQNKHIYYTLNINAQGGIQTRNHGLRAIETVHAWDRSATATGRMHSLATHILTWFCDAKDLNIWSRVFGKLSTSLNCIATLEGLHG
jgi:hypothetical protein